ncbi:MAG: glycosyltransferase family 2 protein [Thermoanaerobaculia bacterium]|nr:glycosyltransferase family 2 protein [Thermoanaerobaculia bacterium]
MSVFVATFNAAPLLRLALGSVLRQDMADFEVLVTGDACTDDSEGVVSSFRDARLTFTNRASNSGSQAAAHNDAIPRARGEWVAYLGHDDLWFPAHLSSLLAFARESRADAVHSLCALLGPDSVESIGAPKPGVPYTRHFVPPSSLMHRRSLFDEIGPWGDPDRLPMPVDLEFLSRAARRGARVRFLPRLTVLKWPSPLWRSYSGASDLPQHAAFASLEKDAHALEFATLEKLALAGAEARRGGDDPPGAVVRNAVRVLVRTVVDAWGRERWPLRPYLVRKVRRQRRAARIRRGLPPA